MLICVRDTDNCEILRGDMLSVTMADNDTIIYTLKRLRYPSARLTDAPTGGRGEGVSQIEGGAQRAPLGSAQR